MSNKLKEMRKKMRNLKSQMAKETKTALKEAFKDFFKEHPVVESVIWDQYTPYFNDGDTCTFSVYDFWLKFKKTPAQLKAEAEKCFADDPSTSLKEWEEYLASEEAAEEDWYDKEYGGSKSSKEEKAAIKAINKIYRDIVDEDVFLDMFGDHVSVTATSAGFKVKECQHD